nr:RNA polymerase II transcription factor B subunit 4 isoform X2 [Ipomoea batatas]GMD33062.1 RNA polymerase II transcription factor B subunit 4 isoform X2 [Ipomoea batatas]GMD34600.1 RNA polymerase II transcription factor B subunit 4 isoform X2 [Ipomoea batatas]GMD36341.1 RNA polymerase II transcription factor B subunit 4 isoform X2 [Ipomoea batatas]
MDCFNIFRLCLLLICILVPFYIFPGLWELTSVLRAFATKIQLTWAIYALFVYPFSASIRLNARHADRFLVRLEDRNLHRKIRRKDTG